MIYLDNAATTKPYISDGFTDISYRKFGNAGSPHKLGREAKKIIDTCRQSIASSINAKPENVIFTSSGTEANNLAILGMANYLKNCGKTHIITSQYEHHSVLNTMKEMERRGFEVTYLDVKDRILTSSHVCSNIRDDTGLVSIMYINNETGDTNRVEDIYALCKEKGILFHSDCVQAAELVDMNKVADMISISGHKIHAQKGIGCLCVKNPEILSPIIFGGEQEFGLRAGTENVSLITDFAAAVTRTIDNKDNMQSMFLRLSGRFIIELIALAVDENNNVRCEIISKNLGKIVSVLFPDVDAETLILALSERGVYISSGAACSSNLSQPSHVLTAIGLTEKEARSTVRISFGTMNTLEEMTRAAEIIIETVKELTNNTF